MSAEGFDLDNIDAGEMQTNSNDIVDVEGQPNLDPDYIDEPNSETPVQTDEDVIKSDTDAPYDKFAEPGRIRRMGTVLNLLNTLLGAGILGVPNSLISCGYVIGALLITLVAILTQVCTILIMKLHRRLDADGYDDIATKVLGRAGSISLSIMSMVYCYSCMVSYLIINYGTIASWFDLGGHDVSGVGYRALIVFISGMIAPVALTFPRQIGWMVYGSYSSFGGIIFYCIAMIIKAGMNLPFPSGAIKPEVNAVTGGMGIFSAISVYSLAFALPVVVLPIVDPYNKDMRKRSIATGTALFLCWLTVIVPGVIGYLLFGEDTKTIVLESFESDDWLMFCVRIGFIFTVTFSYPAIGQSVMASWSSVFYNTNLQGELPFSKRIWVIVATNIIPMGLAMFLPDAKPALNIGGAFGGCLADFFYPALIWILVDRREQDFHWGNWKIIGCIVMVVFGVVAAVISTYQAIVDAIDAFTS